MVAAKAPGFQLPFFICHLKRYCNVMPIYSPSGHSTLVFCKVERDNSSLFREKSDTVLKVEAKKWVTIHDITILIYCKIDDVLLEDFLF